MSADFIPAEANSLPSHVRWNTEYEEWWYDTEDMEGWQPCTNSALAECGYEDGCVLIGKAPHVTCHEDAP